MSVQQDTINRKELLDEDLQSCECPNEGCDYEAILQEWRFCPECGTPVADQDDPMLILKESIAWLAFYELDPYEFKIFMFIYFQTLAVGVSWKRIKQDDLEKSCSISHPKVLKSIKELKGDNCEESLVVGEDAGKLLHWITQESKIERWSKRQGYGLHEDMDDSERLKELLKPFVDERRKRNRSWY